MDKLFILGVAGMVVVMLVIVTAYVLGANVNEQQHQAEDKQKADEIKQAIVDSVDNTETTSHHANIDDTENDGIIAINPDDKHDDK